MRLDYIKPEIEIVEIETATLIATSFADPQIDEDEIHGGGPARSHRRFWKED